MGEKLTAGVGPFFVMNHHPVNLEDIQLCLLQTLEKQNIIENTASWGVFDGVQLDQQEILGALKSLEMREMVKYETIEEESWNLTAEGLEIVENGSHEAKVYNILPSDDIGLAIEEITQRLGEFGKIGQANAFKKKWIAKKEKNIVRAVPTIFDETAVLLKEIKETGKLESNPAALTDLKKRKLIQPQKKISFKVMKGPKFSLTIEKLATDLTWEMILDGSWQSTTFKPYNLNSMGRPTAGGHLHPLLKVREEFRQIFFEMGFTEMPTNQYVESSFWNFDTLFQAQQHPARDSHDTFFIKNPATTKTIPADFMEATKAIHEVGGFGSIGYKYEWQEEESRKNILRTHTTAVSSRMLYKLAKEGSGKPAKYFSIDRVYRNETLDATHLAEFHQIEGLVADYDLNLGHLIGMLKEFFRRLGMTQLRFKPAYNPYTEPSMEVFAFHEGLGKWIEVGNSGVFRPEMLRPMGFDERMTVIAWGLSLERPTMIKYGLSNIRDLVGHKVDLAVVQSNPICRLDK